MVSGFWGLKVLRLCVFSGFIVTMIMVLALCFVFSDFSVFRLPVSFVWG